MKEGMAKGRPVLIPARNEGLARSRSAVLRTRAILASAARCRQKADQYLL
jgi:hypothetical protein